MPNPLSKVSSAGWILGNDVLTNELELGALVAKIITGWSMTEANLGNIFAVLAGSKHPVALSMYSAVNSFQIQKDLLLAASKDLLTLKRANIFKAVVNIISKSARPRHDFAHHMVGKPVNVANAIFLIDPKYYWSFKATRHKHFDKIMRKRGNISMATLINFPDVDQSKMIVYRKMDLEQINERMEQAFILFGLLYGLIAADASGRQALYRQLYNRPDVRLEI
jgi:hypothetical protein